MDKNKTKFQQIKEHHEAFRKQIEETGNFLLDKELPALTKEMFCMYEKNGNRLLYENEYFERRRFLVVFGLLSFWYQRQEDIQKLEYVIKEICKEETWALPAHINRKKKGWQREVDLFAAETGQALANIIYLNQGCLSPDLVKKTRELVIFRLLDSYMEVPRGKWRWESFYNNWVAVCASCVGSAALFLLEDDKEKQQAIIRRVCDTLPDYLAGMHDDGTCPEGMSYFTYGMTFYVGFARQLKEHSQGSIDLLDSEKVRNIARFQHKCYFHGGNTVSFSDGERADRFRLGLTCYLTRTIEGVEIPDISAAMEFETDHCYRFMGNLQDDVWVQEYLEKAAEEESNFSEWFTMLPDAQWAIWRDRNVGFAFKGGNNAEAHNHNDVGSFLLTADGEVFLTDLGCGEYTREYFAPETRYQILCNRSAGHNVPIINGQEQKNGEEYKCEYFRCYEPGKVELSYAEAYREVPDWKLVRTIENEKNSEKVSITDRITGNGVFHFQERLVTQIEPVIQKEKILLHGIRGRLEIQVSKECGRVVIEKEVFRNHRGKDEDVWLMTFPVLLKDGEGFCRIQCNYVRNRSE